MTHTNQDGVNLLVFRFSTPSTWGEEQRQALNNYREMEIAKYLLIAQNAQLDVQAQSQGAGRLIYNFSLPSELTKS